MKRALSLAILFVLVGSISIFGQTKKRRSVTKQKAAVSNVVPEVNSVILQNGQAEPVPKQNTDEPPQDKWLFLYTDRISITSYNFARVRDLGNGEVEFWLKTLILNKEKFWDSLKLQPTPKAPSSADLAYTLDLYKIDCNRHRIALTANYLYSVHRRVAFSVEDPQPYSRIVPDSIAEFEERIFCPYVK